MLVFARLANYGVMMLSPLFLVRLFTVEQFGEYRGFMLYAGILQWIAGFSINDSLLYFIPVDPARTRAWIRSSILLVAILSSTVVAVALGADAAMDGGLFGWFAAPLAIYLLAFSNFDFWEGWYLSTGRTTAVLVYSTVRLALRMAVIVVVAAVWRDVQVVVWAVAITESLRLAGSAWLWWRWDRKGRSEQGMLDTLREQWRFCTATGLSRLVVMLNRNIGAVLIDRTLGKVELARFTVATYPEPAISAVTKSVFTVSLPELVRRRATEGAAAFDVWKRTVSWTSAGILPLLAYTLVAARDLIHVAFGEEYVSAAPLLQVFLIVMARKCVDFAVPLQAIGETRPLLLSNVVSLAVNAVALALLLPGYGSLGVVIAIAIATMVEPMMLAPLVSRRFGQRLARLLHWREMGKILLCTLAVAAVARAVQGAGLGPMAYLLVSAPTAFGTGALVLFLTRSSCAQAVLRVLRNGTHRPGWAR